MTTRRGSLLALATVGYVLVLAALVFTPISWALNRFTVRLYVLFRYTWPIAPDWALPEHYGLLLNVVLFVPLGYLMVRLTGRSGWWAIVAALAGSLGIEAVQLGLDREPSWADVATNTLGGGLGAVLATLISRRRPGPDG